MRQWRSAEPLPHHPRGLLIAMLVLTLLYVSIQVIAQGTLGSALAHSAVPLADAMAPISPVLRLMMLAGAALSIFGSISTDLLCSPRVLLAIARDGLLPRVSGKVNPATHTPNAAILCYAALAITPFVSTGTSAGTADPACVLGSNGPGLRISSLTWAIGYGAFRIMSQPHSPGNWN